MRPDCKIAAQHAPAKAEQAAAHRAPAQRGIGTFTAADQRELGRWIRDPCALMALDRVAKEWRRQRRTRTQLMLDPTYLERLTRAARALHDVYSGMPRLTTIGHAVFLRESGAFPLAGGGSSHADMVQMLARIVSGFEAALSASRGVNQTSLDGPPNGGRPRGREWELAAQVACIAAACDINPADNSVPFMSVADVVWRTVGFARSPVHAVRVMRKELRGRGLFVVCVDESVCYRLESQGGKRPVARSGRFDEYACDFCETGVWWNF
jgi:hypothetical protein